MLLTQAQWVEKVKHEIFSISCFVDAEVGEVEGDPNDFKTWKLPVALGEGESVFYLQCSDESDIWPENKDLYVETQSDDEFFEWAREQAHEKLVSLGATSGVAQVIPLVGKRMAREEWSAAIWFRCLEIGRIRYGSDELEFAPQLDQHQDHDEIYEVRGISDC
jgi:hypothetical protein